MRQWFFFLVCALIWGTAEGALPSDIDLTRGNRNKWRIFNFTRGGFIKGQGFSGTCASGGRLVTEEIKISASDADTVEVIHDGLWKSSKLYFHGRNGKFSESAMVRGTGENGVTIFSPGRNRHWKGEITALRLDIHGVSAVKIKNIRFSKSDGTVSLKSPWLGQTALAAQGEVSVTREPVFPRPLHLKGTSDAPLEIKCVQYDIFGKELGREILKFDAGAWKGTFRFYPRSALFKTTVKNPGMKKTAFSLRLFQTDAGKKESRQTYRVSIVNVPQKTDENTVWCPEVVFSGAVPRGKYFRLRLRGEGTLNVIVADTLMGKGKTKRYYLPPVYFRYFTPGKYTLEAEVENMPCLIGAKSFRHIKKQAVVPPRTVIDRSGKRPVYVINGHEKVSTMEYLLSDPPPSPWAIRQALNACSSGIKGIRLRLIFRFTPEGKVTFDEIDSAALSEPFPGCQFDAACLCY